MSEELRDASSFRMLCWNLGAGGPGPKANWNHVAATAVDGCDAALLQEAPEPSEDGIRTVPSRGGSWGLGRSRAQTAIAQLSERVTLDEVVCVRLGDEEPGQLGVSRPGTLAVATLTMNSSHEQFTVASVYTQWEVAASGGTDYYADASMHRILSDLTPLLVGRDKPIFIAGDFNSVLGANSYEWGERKAARNASVFERMAGLGLRLAGPRAPSQRPAGPVPDELPADTKNVVTFGARPENRFRQLDYCYVTEELAHRVTVDAHNADDDWGPSDHCKITIAITAPQARVWDAPMFRDEIVAVHGEPAGRVVAALEEWARRQGLRSEYGAGHEGEWYLQLDDGPAGGQTTFSVRTRGDIVIRFQYMTSPFHTPEARDRLRTDLNKIPGIDIGDGRLNGKPLLSQRALVDGDSRDAFLAVFSNLVARTRATPPT